MRTKPQALPARFLGLSLALVVVLAVTAPADGQVVRRMGGPSPDVVTIAEVQAQVGLAENGEGLEIVGAMPAANRTGAYKEVNLKAGDRILALNGKLVRSVEDFKSSYEGIAVGEELEIGVQRGDQRWIERFAKADPASLPTVRRVQIQGNPEDLVIMMGIGVILTREDGEIRVNTVLPGGPATKHFEVGDVFVSLNGTKDLEPGDLQALWQALPTGADAEFALRRGEEAVTFSIEKVDSPGTQRRVISQ